MLKKLIERIENIVKTDIRYLVKHGARLSTAHGFAVACGVILYFLFGRFVSKDAYGNYKYLLTLFSLFSITTLTSAEVALGRAIARGFHGTFHDAFFLKLKGGLVGSALTLVCSAYYAMHGAGDLAISLVLLAIFAPFIYATNIYGSYFVGRQDTKSYLNWNILISLASTAGMVLAILFLHTQTLLFLAFLLTSSLSIFAFLAAKRSVASDTHDIEFQSLALHLSALDILGVVANNIDSVLVFHFLGAAPLAIYTFATSPVEQLKGFLKSAQSIAMPKFSVASLTTLQETIWRKLWFFALFTALVSAVYAVCIPFVFHILFPNYLSAIPFSQIYVFSLVLGVPGALLTSLLQAKGLKREMTWFTFIQYTLQILFLCIGAFYAGIWGVIIARIASRASIFAITSLLVHRAKDST